jgi:hypothetical protein
MTDDLISRSALLEAYDKAHKGPPGGARKLIEEAPEAVIRCKDCKNWKPGEIVRDNFIPPRCDLNGGGWSSDNYCSWAIRKEK